jgi:hypothetical protein
MSGYQPVGAELLYSYFGAGTVSVPTVTPGSSMTLGYPPITVPGGYMKNSGSWASSLKLVGGGLLITTATVPTFQFSLWRTMAQPATWAASGSAVLVGQTAISTAPGVSTGAPFEMEWNIGLRTAGVVSGGSDATSTVVCFGKVWSYAAQLTSAAGPPSDFVLPVPAVGATYSPTDTTWPMDQQVYLWPTLSLGAATAGNTATMEWLKLYGEN